MHFVWKELLTVCLPLLCPAAEENDMVAVEGERMLRLAEQCLERAKSFIAKTTAPPDHPASPSAASSCSASQSESELSATSTTNTGEYIVANQQFFVSPSLSCSQIKTRQYKATLSWDFVSLDNHHFLCLYLPCALTAPSSDALIDTAHKATSPAKTGHHGALSEGVGGCSPFLPPEVFQRLQTVEIQNSSKK